MPVVPIFVRSSLSVTLDKLLLGLPFMHLHLHARMCPSYFRGWERDTNIWYIYGITLGQAGTECFLCVMLLDPSNKLGG